MRSPFGKVLGFTAGAFMAFAILTLWNVQSVGDAAFIGMASVAVGLFIGDVLDVEGWL